MFDSHLSDASDSLNQFVDPTSACLSNNGEIPNLFASPSGISRSIADAKTSLQAIATSPDLMTKLEIAFGMEFDRGIANSLFQHFASGDFSVLPTVEILSDRVLPGANSAFAAATDRVYLRDRFVTENVGKPDAITGVLLEEYGHAIDSLINAVDAAGDEGEIFAAIGQGRKLDDQELLRLKAEDDSISINLNGKEILLEGNVTVTATVISSGQPNTDVDGDGRDDAIVSTNGGLVVRRSNGSKFLPNEVWTEIGFGGIGGTLIGNSISSPTSSTPNPSNSSPIMTLQEFESNRKNWSSYNSPTNPFSSSYTLPNGEYHYGNCTWYAYGRMLQLGFSKAALDTMRGNASEWDNTAENGASVSSTPQVGAITNWEFNHVAVVEKVNSDGTILISESNWDANNDGVYNEIYATRTISKSRG
jgi:surface antigen